MQLYFDFSGYIDMAIGLSLMFNIRLPLNFFSPYKADSIIDFWRRWHMTLSRFLRDYLYFPLGGNRKGGTRRYLNLMITMVLGGLWHGANWTFVAWGALHGAFLVVNHAWRAVKPLGLLAALPRVVRESVARAVTFVAVVVAWVFFRSADFSMAVRVLRGMAGFNGFALSASPPAYSEFDLALMALKVPSGRLWIATAVLYAAALFAVFFLPNSQELVEPERYRRESGSSSLAASLRWRPTALWAIACAGLVAISLMTFTRISEFLYFQF